MNTTISIPSRLSPLLTDKKAVMAKQLIMGSLNSVILEDYTAANDSKMESFGVYFTSRETAQIRKAMNGSPYKFADFASNILTCVLDKASNDCPGEPVIDIDQLGNWTTKAEKILKRAVKKPYPVQKKLLAGLLKGLGENKIIMGEAATGSGKGLVIGAAAYEMARQNPSSVTVVCAPSFAVLRQLHQEYSRVAGRRGPEAIFIMGRQEFVSVNRLLRFLDDNEQSIPSDDLKNIKDWLDSGGKSNNELIPYCWQTSVLSQIAPNTPVSDLSLNGSEDETDEGVVAYLEHKSEIHEASVVFCSHAMLAHHIKLIISTKGGVGHLPDFDYVLIDEAHLFEQALINAYSERFSFQSSLGKVRYATQRLKKGHKLYTGLRHCYERIVKIGQEASTVFLSHHSTGSAGEIHDHMERWKRSLVNLNKTLKEEAGDKKSIKAHDLRNISSEITDDIHALNEIARIMKRDDPVQMDYSPVRAYPRLHASPETVYPYLRYFWKTITAGACISATLFTPKKNLNTFSSEFMQRRLGIDSQQLLTIKPEYQDWLYKPVTLYLAELGEDRDKYGRPMLMPPTERYTKDKPIKTIIEIKESWYQEVAAAIQYIAEQEAKGGTLCLLTSHESVAGIHIALCEMLKSSDRIITSNPDEHFSLTRQRYMAMVEKGCKPIWLATGQAWTGLDLRSPGKAKHDLALTDLVIPRLPIGVNQNPALKTTQSYAASGYSILVLDMLIMLKQGIGRLVRQQHCPEKRLYLLDQRLNHPAFQFLSSLVSQVLKYYQKRETLYFK